MRIGIDFDNTLVCYDRLFLVLAKERGVLPEGLAGDKTSVRDYLRGIGQENVWTEMQGLAYGARIGEAEAFPGVLDFVRAAVGAGHPVFIVSHKTRQPLAGPACDLHAAARGFLSKCGITEAGVRQECVFLEPTKEAKLQRIAELQLEVFVDDLPEFLGLPGFPSQTRKLLFQPSGRTDSGPWEVVGSWAEISGLLGLAEVRS